MDNSVGEALSTENGDTSSILASCKAVAGVRVSLRASSVLWLGMY